MLITPTCELADNLVIGAPTCVSELRTTFAVISAPLSDRICSGTPRMSMTSAMIEIKAIYFRFDLNVWFGSCVASRFRRVGGKRSCVNISDGCSFSVGGILASADPVIRRTTKGRAVMNANARGEFNVAVVGGGPGGLFSAWHLAAKAGSACKITIYEATSRLGGKIVTNQFAGVGPYEAGVAEIYDYSHIGPDPLRDLIENELHLPIRHIKGGACVLNDKIVHDLTELGEHFGPETQRQAELFYNKCASLLSPSEYYSSARNVDNPHVWSKFSGERLLCNEIADETASRYVRAMAHSDVAAAPHFTNGLTFLKNALMDDPTYMRMYSVDGGNEQIVSKLADELDAEVKLDSPLKSIQPLDDGTYRLEFGLNGAVRTTVADYVIIALPLTALSIIKWQSLPLQQAIDKHIHYFDRPGHYLRATLLFERPYWREHISGAWWMCDAFDGCCVYDEGSRHDLGQWGALGFLIAGNAALGMANLPDDKIVEMCLDTLPTELAYGRELIVDSRVHRWMASVNAIPGGYPARSPYLNHRPNAERFPRLVLVGDYMFDSTLNGVLNSADSATDIVISDVLFRRRGGVDDCSRIELQTPPERPPYEQIHDPDFLADMFDITWNLKPGARVLHLGSGSGNLVAALRERGFDAWGIEADHATQKQTSDVAKKHNLRGEYDNLPADIGKFDVVLETALCTLGRQQASRTIAEMRRVTRRGAILGSVTVDLMIDIIERNDLLVGVRTLTSRWDWSDQLCFAGFDFALANSSLLDLAWRRAQEIGAGPGHWYEDAESMMYCFLSVDDKRAVQMQAAARTSSTKFKFHSESVPEGIIIRGYVDETPTLTPGE